MTHDEATPILTRLQAAWHERLISKAGLAFYRHELSDLPADEVAVAVEALIRSGTPHLPLAGQIRRKVMELRLDPPTWAEATKLLLARARDVETWREPDGCSVGNADCHDGFVYGAHTYNAVERRACLCAPTEADRVRRMNMLMFDRGTPCPEGKCDGSGYVFETVEREHEAASACACLAQRGERRLAGMNPVLASFVRLVSWGDIRRWLLDGDTNLEAQMRNKYREHVDRLLDNESLAGIDAPLPRIERANREALFAPSVPVPALREIPMEVGR